MPPVIGLPLDRRDGRVKVTGRAKYTAEFAIDGTACAVIVQSTIPSGMIASFDLVDAHAVPGVLVILTPDNAPRLKPAAESSNPTAPDVIRVPLLQTATSTTTDSISRSLSPIRSNAPSTPPRWSRPLTGKTRRRSICAMRSPRPIHRSIFAMARGRPTAGAAIPRRRSRRPLSASTSCMRRQPSTTIRWNRTPRSRCGRAMARRRGSRFTTRPDTSVARSGPWRCCSASSRNRCG